MLNRIIPITDLRRNFGALTQNLATIESLILTRDGQPFAILKAVPSVKRKVMRKAAGAWHKTPLDDDKIWKEVFKRKSRSKSIIV